MPLARDSRPAVGGVDQRGDRVDLRRRRRIEDRPAADRRQGRESRQARVPPAAVSARPATASRCARPPRSPQRCSQPPGRADRRTSCPAPPLQSPASRPASRRRCAAVSPRARYRRPRPRGSTIAVVGWRRPQSRPPPVAAPTAVRPAPLSPARSDRSRRRRRASARHRARRRRRRCRARSAAARSPRPAPSGRRPTPPAPRRRGRRLKLTNSADCKRPPTVTGSTARRCPAVGPGMSASNGTGRAARRARPPPRRRSARSDRAGRWPSRPSAAGPGHHHRPRPPQVVVAGRPGQAAPHEPRRRDPTGRAHGQPRVVLQRAAQEGPGPRRPALPQQHVERRRTRCRRRRRPGLGRGPGILDAHG